MKIVDPLSITDEIKLEASNEIKKIIETRKTIAFQEY